MGWKRNAMPLMPWVKLLDEQLAGISKHNVRALPTFQGKDVWVFSDYSGQQKASDFSVIAMLLMDADASPEWPRARSAVRSRFLSDGRRMSFKGLNDKRKQAALVPFLEAADLLFGLLAVVAIHKDVQCLCSGEEAVSTYDATLQLEGRWNEKSFESMLRICHFVSLIVAGLTVQREVIWITDQDEFIANAPKTRDVSRIAAGILTAYAPCPRRTVQFGSTAVDEADRGLEDLTAVPDIVAGATAEFVTYLWRASDGVLSLDEWPGPPNVTTKTDVIMTWWSQAVVTLRRILWVITEETRNGVRGLRLRRIISD